MKNEFPQIDVWHKDFLRNWWEREKLLIGNRRTGKTTLMVLEARRFAECGFDVVFLTKNASDKREVSKIHGKIFGSHPNFDFVRYNTSGLRGRKIDVLILDDVWWMEEEDFKRNIGSLNPLFVRASVPKNTTSTQFYRKELESVYEI